MIKFTMFLFLFKSKYRVKHGTLPSFDWLLSVFIVINLCCAVVSEGGKGHQARCDKGCYNGDCVQVGKPGADENSEDNYKCECWDGWRGEKCELCGGKVKLKENAGQTWLAEAVGNYTTNMKCTWVVEAETPDSRIRLHLRDFETECGWDHLYIWDGDNIFNGLQVHNFGFILLYNIQPFFNNHIR